MWARTRRPQTRIPYLPEMFCSNKKKKLHFSWSYNDFQHCHFKKKSVYDRRDNLYKTLSEINNKEVLKKLNKDLKRKRLINVVFLIKKIL